MFPLHERTRRRICRVLFIALGVLPTSAVLAYSAIIHTAAHKETVRTQLADALGLDVRVETVSNPRPETTLLTGFELLDPDSGELLLSARVVEVSRAANGVSIIASQPEVYAAGLNRLWPLLTKQWFAATNAPETNFRITAAELTLRWQQKALTVADFELNGTSSESARSMTAICRSAAGDPSITRLRWQRTGTVNDASTALEIDADATPLPCSLLAAILHKDNGLGTNCNFRGKLWGSQTAGGSQLEAAGQFDELDLQSVIGYQFPHRLSGTASMTIDRAIVRDGRLEEAKGAIHAGPGAISRSLVKAAIEMIRMRGPAATAELPAALAFDELSAAFDLNAKGLAIRGKCAGAEPGTILRLNKAPLLAEGDGPVPVTALVQTLVPESRLQVPATRQTDWLLNLLPLPDAQPFDPHAAPSARLRGGPDLH